MKRLKLQFLIFFLLFAAAVGFLLVNSFRQMAIEERSIWTSTAERVYNQMQAAISEFLNQEDGRSFSEYRYYQAMPGVQATDANLSISPLASLELESGITGLLGYFQIDPDGSFSTPYLPSEGGSFSAEEKRIRQSREAQIEGLTSSLKTEVYREAKADRTGSGGALQGDYDEADAEVKKVTAMKGPLRISEGNVKNVYPNPIQEQKLSFSKAKPTSLDGKMKKEESYQAEVSQLSRRVYAPSAVQSKAFEEQTKSPESPAQGTFADARKGRLDELIKAQTPSLMIDPFQARLVSEKYLIFYRKIWLNEKLYFQGFIVELKKFFDWAMDRSFANSDLMAFAKAELHLGPEVLAQFGPALVAGAGAPLLDRSLGYPLNRFGLEILAGQLPQLSARMYLNLLTGLIVLLATVGLYLIYRSAASQVRLSQKRQDFVSAVTHELKTPLTSIRMYSEMLEDGWVQDDAKRKEYYRHLSKESGRLSSLIDNVLQLARLEKQTYKLQMQTARPDRDFDEWVEDVRKLAEVRGFQLSATRSPDLPEIRYDPDAVQQVLMILLDNSMKFSAEKSIEMKLRPETGALVLEWSDRGPGLPPAELGKIFDKFYRVENEMTRKTQGTGIGLAMAKIIVESMAATIEARNREGGGLSLLIRFPIYAG